MTGTGSKAVFFLSGKSPEQITAALRDMTREQLLQLVISLATVDRLLTAQQIAQAAQIDKREVLRQMHAGEFSDPIFGAGFLVLARNSFRVSAAAFNEWKRRRFVRGSSAAIPAEKNNGATADGRQNVVEGESAEQRRDLIQLGADANPGDL